MDEAQNAPKKDEFLTKEVLPLYKECKDKLVAIKPATKEMQDLHAAYIAILTESEDGVKMLTKAVKTSDEKLAKSAIDKMTSAGKGEDKFKKDLDDLAKKHDVKFK